MGHPGRYRRPPHPQAPPGCRLPTFAAPQYCVISRHNPGDIRRQAATGDGEIVGRGGAYILPGQDDVPKVFLVASGSVRVVGLSEAEARKWVERIGANRAAYIKQMSDTIGGSWGFDMVLDTGRLGHLPAAEAIQAAAPPQP